jgi:hypothetical protein
MSASVHLNRFILLASCGCLLGAVVARLLAAVVAWPQLLVAVVARRLVAVVTWFLVAVVTRFFVAVVAWLLGAVVERFLVAVVVVVVRLFFLASRLLARHTFRIHLHHSIM